MVESSTTCVLYLHRVEPTVAAEREAKDVCVLVPAVGQGTGHDVSDLREELLDHGPVAANVNPFAELSSHVNHHVVPLATTLPLRPPAF